MSACDKHKETPVVGYHSCPGCEVDMLRAENARWHQNYKHLIEQHMPRTGHGCEEGWSRVVEARELQAENDELRRIISDCASACGAAVSPECSLTFMSGLPEEIRLAIRK